MLRKSKSCLASLAPQHNLTITDYTGVNYYTTTAMPQEENYYSAVLQENYYKVLNTPLHSNK